MSEIQRDEFNAHMNNLAGVLGEIKDHLKDLNGRTRVNEQDIAVLRDRGVRRADPTARWTGAVAIAAGVLFELFKRLTGGAQ